MTSKKPVKRVTTRKKRSLAVVEGEDIDVDGETERQTERPEEQPRQLLRRTRAGRITKPSPKVAIKRRGDAYS